MTREQAMQIIVRDHIAFPGQGGSHSVENTGDGEYEAVWHDAQGERWLINADFTRNLWGRPSLGE